VEKERLPSETSASRCVRANFDSHAGEGNVTRGGLGDVKRGGALAGGGRSHLSGNRRQKVPPRESRLARADRGEDYVLVEVPSGQGETLKVTVSPDAQQ